MNTDKILPIDLYHAVSTANLTLESTLKIIHVEVGQDHELLPLEPGTLAVICRGGKFECKALGKEISIVAGQVFLASVEDVSDISRFSETGFEGIVIYAGSDLLINRQRLMFRTITPDELEESGLYIRLMQSQIERMTMSVSKWWNRFCVPLFSSSSREDIWRTTGIARFRLSSIISPC